MDKRITLQMEHALSTACDAELSAMLREYVQESNHQSWDAWSKRDLRGVCAFFRDFMLFMDAYRADSRGAGASLHPNSRVHRNMRTATTR